MFFGISGLYGLASSIAFDSDYQAVLDYGTSQGYTLPSSSGQTLQNQLVLDLKSAGIWNSLDVFYMFATDGDSDFACLNWKSAGDFTANRIGTGLTFTIGSGFTGNGLDSYIDTGYVPSTDATNFTLNDASFFVWKINNVAENSVDGSADDASATNGCTLQARSSSDLAAVRINRSNTVSASNTDSRGLFHGNRTSSTALALYKNGAFLNSNSIASAAITSFSIYLEAFNQGGTAASFSTKGIAMAGLGGSVNQSSLYSHVNAYFLSI